MRVPRFAFPLNSIPDQKPRFATLDIVLGSLYIAACVFELFGATAAIMVRITPASLTSCV